MLDALTRLLSPAQARLLGQFLRFGVVGAGGFLVDTATVYALKGWLGLYGAGAVAFLTAATVNWAINRAWTFAGQGAGTALHRQWAAFLAFNALGFVVNRGVYAVLVTVSALCADQPVFAVAAGSVAGMFLNFHFSRTRVFR